MEHLMSFQDMRLGGSTVHSVIRELLGLRRLSLQLRKAGRKAVMGWMSAGRFSVN